MALCSWPLHLMIVVFPRGEGEVLLSYSIYFLLCTNHFKTSKHPSSQASPGHLNFLRQTCSNALPQCWIWISNVPSTEEMCRLWIWKVNFAFIMVYICLILFIVNVARMSESKSGLHFLIILYFVFKKAVKLLRRRGNMFLDHLSEVTLISYCER